MTLALAQYRGAIGLDTPWSFAASPDPVSADTVDRLVRHFATEAGVAPTVHGRPPIALLRALLTQRPSWPIPDAVQADLDEVLHELAVTTAVTRADNLPTIAERFPASRYRAAAQTCLWHGDITTLATDAIVNAANDQLLGCFIPLHACIDNAIHWRAGPRLRADCEAIMRAQGHAEPTGTTKATRAYHLPSRFVLHTVGPVIRAPLNGADVAALSSCYGACLKLADELPNVATLAFCGISTGVFGFPKPEAAQIALDTVSSWLAIRSRPDLRVIFNVFSVEDEAIYVDALECMA